MATRFGQALLIVAAALWAGGPASGADEPAETRSGESAWNARVEFDDSKSQREETTETMRLRVFEDIDDRVIDDGDYDGRRRPGIAVDVETVTVTCPDGYTWVDRVNVGGKDIDTEGECRAEDENRITVEGLRIERQTDGRSAEPVAD